MMLILVTGRWGDDWCFYNQPDWSLYSMAFQLGRPSLIGIIQFAKLFPECGYRVITFFMYYACMLFLYNTLKSLKFSDNKCFWICALYAIMPANDARIQLNVFPYTIGTFFFMAGLSYFATSLLNDNLGVRQRVISCFIFTCSFILNSNLFFYLLVIMLIIYKERKISNLFSYKEYLLIPFLFIGLKLFFFPAYGIYDGYNAITFIKLIKALLLLIPADFFVLFYLVFNFAFRVQSYIVIAFIFIVICIVFFDYNKVKCNLRGNYTGCISNRLENIANSDNFKLFLLGFLALSLALYPYIVAKETFIIKTAGVGGRNATLVALGASLIVYSTTKMVIKEKMQKIFLCIVIACGIFYFNCQYLLFQLDYYRQLGFQYQLAQHMELSKTHNIIYINPDPGTVNIQMFYQLNGNAEEVFGTQDKLIMSNIQEFLEKDDDEYKKYVDNGNYHMSDYDVSYRKIDAIVVYSMRAGIKDTFIMKIYELIGSENFRENIVNRSFMQVYLRNSEEYNQFLIEKGYNHLVN